MKQRKLIFLGMLMLLLMALSACGSQVSSEPLAVTIEGHDISYEPEAIEVRAGQPVQLTFANHGSLEHDVTFDRLPIAGDGVIALGEEAQHEHEEDAEHEHEEEAEHEHEEDAEHEGDEEAPEEGSHSHENATVHLHTVAGEAVTAAFTPTEPGTYEFYCSVPGHREAGMVGTLIVSEG